MNDAFLQRIWYGRSAWALLLLPLSWLFITVAAVRRGCYRIGILRTRKVRVPIIVVGNISVGGTGKTPFVLWLVHALRERGFNPGIITRGYRGQSHEWPCVVTAKSDPIQVGDEAVLLAERSDGIVVSGPDRVASASKAVELGANVIIADDGLQHYGLARDAEIAVVDASRWFGNGYRLPAGPLRESPKRLRRVDVIVWNLRDRDGEARASFGRPLEVTMSSRIVAARSLTTGKMRALHSFSAMDVHAIAGIGNPEGFFEALRSHGLRVDARALQDHAPITKQDVAFADTAPIIMTEKDAVKCRDFADERFWVVPLTVEVNHSGALLDAVLRKLDSPRQAAHSAHSNS